MSSPAIKKRLSRPKYRFISDPKREKENFLDMVRASLQFMSNEQIFDVIHDLVEEKGK